ncbi:MAG TPA: hypothetical protein VF035_00895 [Longimicrobiales bacterium]
MSAAAKAPPGTLPGSHFAAALVFLLIGITSLVVHAHELAAASYLDPRLTATTHLFTLGWITTSIMGALYQFLPVALGQPIRSVRLAYATLILYVPGLLLFVTGLGTGHPLLMLPGAALFGTGVLLFIGNMCATLHRATKRDVTWYALACAVFFLTVTLVLGLALAGNLRWGYLGANRMTALGVHMHVALAGWVLLVMVGVAHRLLPMFLLSHGAKDHFAKAAVALIATGAALLAFVHHGPPLVGRWLPALLIALGCIAFLLQARSFYRHRHRRALDPGMRLAAGALGILALALIFAWPVIVSGANANIAVAYIMTVLLAISLFVAAHYFKIVPFLVWYHRFGPLAGKRPVPRVNELYSVRTAFAAAGLLATGALTLIVGVPHASAPVARAGALLMLAGAATESTQMFMLWRMRP